MNKAIKIISRIVAALMLADFSFAIYATALTLNVWGGIGNIYEGKQELLFMFRIIIFLLLGIGSIVSLIKPYRFAAIPICLYSVLSLFVFNVWRLTGNSARLKSIINGIEEPNQKISSLTTTVLKISTWPSIWTYIILFSAIVLSTWIFVDYKKRNATLTTR